MSLKHMYHRYNYRNVIGRGSNDLTALMTRLALLNKLPPLWKYMPREFEDNRKYQHGEIENYLKILDMFYRDLQKRANITFANTERSVIHASNVLMEDGEYVYLPNVVKKLHFIVEATYNYYKSEDIKPTYIEYFDRKTQSTYLDLCRLCDLIFKYIYVNR